MNIHKQENIATLIAQPSDTNIFLKWTWINNTVPLFVKKTLVFYIKEGDSSIYSLQPSENSFKTEHTIENVTQNINYHICIRPMMTSNWPGIRDSKICTNVINNRWEMSAFIGSIAGALLALFLIILLILMSKRFRNMHKLYSSNTDKNVQRQRFDSAFDSVANKEENSFYDDLVTSEVSFMDGSYRLSGDNSLSSSTSPSLVINGDEAHSKSIKKRTSLIEEEAVANQISDALINTITLEDVGDSYRRIQMNKANRKSPSRSLKESNNRIVETCIEELDRFQVPRKPDNRPKSVSPKIRVTKCPRNEQVK